jgi:hypothetical protein
VSTTRVKAASTHVDGAPGHVGADLISEVPAAGAHSVELTRDGVVIATKTRSAHPPTVTLLTPATGARIASTGTVPVTWKAADADGDPLDVVLSYSDDGGRTFRGLAIGGFPGRTTVPAALFSKSTDGRIRIVVNDGFDEASALSGRLRASGGAPVVRIVQPVKALSVRADVGLALLGEAYEDTGERITKPARLTWLDGTRRVARGSRATVTGLSAGTHRLTLRARGTNGITSATAVQVKVLGVKPDLMFTPPTSLKRNARRLKLRVSSTVPATLRAGGRTFAVSRKARAISIPIRPGRAALAVKLVVRGGGGRATYVVRVRRR